MVVKFADTQKEKDQKRIQQVTTNIWGMNGIGLNSLTPSPYLTVRKGFSRVRPNGVLNTTLL